MLKKFFLSFNFAYKFRTNKSSSIKDKFMTRELSSLSDTLNIMKTSWNQLHDLAGGLDS